MERVVGEYYKVKRVITDSKDALRSANVGEYLEYKGLTSEFWMSQFKFKRLKPYRMIYQLQLFADMFIETESERQNRVFNNKIDKVLNE